MAALLGRGRTMSSLAVKGLKLGKGTPAAAVKANEVLVKMIASPINSGDLVTSTSGSEGVGMVAAKGDKVTALREGDWVLPPLGTMAWASEMVVDQSQLVRVSYFTVDFYVWWRQRTYSLFSFHLLLFLLHGLPGT